jgi:ABC-type multidrug transport system permease subunit
MRTLHENKQLQQECLPCSFVLNFNATTANRFTISQIWCSFPWQAISSWIFFSIKSMALFFVASHFHHGFFFYQVDIKIIAFKNSLDY